MEPELRHAFECRIEKLKYYSLIVTDLENSLDDVMMELDSQNRYKYNLPIFNGNRNDEKIIDCIRSDLELRAYISDMENTMELIMQKYRNHTQQRIESSKIEFLSVKEKCFNCHCQEKIESQAKQIDELVKMMAEIMSDGSNQYNRMLEENIKLKTEILSLREILKASNAINLMETRDVACGWLFNEEDSNDEEDLLDTSRKTVCENPSFNH